MMRPITEAELLKYELAQVDAGYAAVAHAEDALVRRALLAAEGAAALSALTASNVADTRRRIQDAIARRDALQEQITKARAILYGLLSVASS